MPNPRSLAGRLASTLLRRRPSPAMAVALLALFLAAGGVSWAATALPRDSVGAEQLQNNAVTNPKIRNDAVGNRKIQNNAVGFRKIQPGAVGAVRINKGAVQIRVTGTCTAGGQAITSILNTGKVTCGTTTAAAFNGGQSDPVAITSPTSATQITGVSLAAGSSYLVMANPQITVSAANNTNGHVVVSCTLSVAGSATATQTRSESFDVGFGTDSGAMTASRTQSDVMPLIVSAASATAAQNATVSCTSTLTGTRLGTPTVTAAGTITALQVASNTTLQSTVSTPPAPPSPMGPPAS